MESGRDDVEEKSKEWNDNTIFFFVGKLTDMMVVGTDKIEKSITGAAFNIPLGYFFKRDGKNVDSTPLYEAKQRRTHKNLLLSGSEVEHFAL